MNIEWISVNDRLPAKAQACVSCDVLVCTEHGEYTTANYSYYTKTWYTVVGYYNVADEDCGIVAWAYIPVYELPSVNTPIDVSVPEGYYDA